MMTLIGLRLVGRSWKNWKKLVIGWKEENVEGHSELIGYYYDFFYIFILLGIMCFVG